MPTASPVSAGRGSRTYLPRMAIGRSAARRCASVVRVDARRSERVAATERRISAVARVLDDLVRVPGTGHRVGLDPIVGLVPVFGDLASALVGAWIVVEAWRFRMPGVVIARMVVNVAVDLTIGAIPIVGDVFDLVLKSNGRNVELFRRYARDPGAATGPHRTFFAGIALVLAGLAWLMIVVIGRILSIEIPAPSP
jgi:hypothetical protein